MASIAFILNDRALNTTDSAGYAIPQDEPQIIADEIARIERLFVYDSINGNHAIEITFTIDFGDEVDTFTRYYSNRVHTHTV